jgi:cyclopropane fatty-acyl-phospholipid synthase-like methyltransferase
MHDSSLGTAKRIKYLLGMSRSDPRVRQLYKERDYLEAYRQHTDLRVEQDPKSAIGGLWEEIGELQFEFLISKNLRPHHKMLDIGCGTLRGGRHFIKYLHPGNYYGIDISRKAISSAEQLIQREGLTDRRPQLVVSENGNLTFVEFCGQRFDYILAQSVFTHLKREHIEECFEHIASVMQGGSAFYFTYNRGETYEQTDLKDFRYPFLFFESLEKQHGFKLRHCSDEYNHPRGQLMVEVKRSDVCVLTEMR